MREGLSGLSNQPPISLEFLLPHTGSDRENILKEVDDVARYHYKLKLAYEAKVRRRFGRTQAGAGGGVDEADREDEAGASMVNDVVSDLSFGELVKGDADDLAAEATDEEEESDSDSDGENSGVWIFLYLHFTCPFLYRAGNWLCAGRTKEAEEGKINKKKTILIFNFAIT